jgi:hypothetical protein
MYKTFDDLEFIKVEAIEGIEEEVNMFYKGVRSKIQFDNGYGASVVSHNYSYGGKEGLYELAVLDENGNLHYDNPVANGDVIGYLKQSDVTDLMISIQELPHRQ